MFKGKVITYISDLKVFRKNFDIKEDYIYELP